MCGIAGIIYKNDKKVTEEQIKTMTDKIIHRGPDAEGVFCDGRYGVGHRRLAIVELSKDGIQPMFSYDNRYVISYNGEIYNYVELREELISLGCKFKTQTDTEVIIEAYRRWGTECVKYFNGMWAIALYDSFEKTVFFSRDRFGVKPLYVLEDEEKLVFASEIKSILELFPEERKVDEITVVRYFKGIQEDSDSHTFYKNIKNFSSATSLIYDIKNNTSKKEKYWEINVSEFKNKYDTKHPYRTFRYLLEDAIKLRLRADVPIGASLSGGLDSSAIVSIMSKKYGVDVNTFSSIYKEEDCNEEEFIRCVNEDTDAIPHYIYPDQSEDIIDDLKKMMYYHDSPNEVASPYSGFCVYRGVGKEVTVMLDGQGADELFGGYLNAITENIKDILDKNTFSSKIHAAKVIGAFQTAIPTYASNITDGQMFDLLGSGSYKRYAEIKNWDNPRNNSLPNNVFTKKFSEFDTDNRWEFPDGVTSRMQQAMYIQLFYSMLPRILHDVDRNSMAFSLEVRLPFLDYRIVEFSYALEAKYKVRNSWTKYIMRRALKTYLPKKIYSRRNKMGFPTPFDVWLRDERYKDIFLEYAKRFGNRGIISLENVLELYNRHIAGQRLERILFKIITLEMWLENYIDTDEATWRFDIA